MISRCFVMLLSIGMLAPAFARAQQLSHPEPASTKTPTDSSADSRMYEDIEIFRRILDRKLQPLYPRTNYAQSIGGMMGMQGGMMGGMIGSQGGMMGMQGGMAPNWFNSNTIWHQEISQTLEGVYLKGQGVVYTATLSSLQLPRSTWKAEAPKPLSEWDSVRREVRNEKEKPKPPEWSKPTELSDLLLKLLAENGHHFARLGENESLTLVITVHEAGSSTPKSKSPRQPGLPPQTEGQATARDHEILGDLHMKQEHYGQARDAYRQALSLKPGRDQTAALARKLARAYLMLDKVEEARAALDLALAPAKEDRDGQDKTASRPAVGLPIKLIVSAPKKLLDQAGEKKITFEEFRRRASVETLKFDAQRR